MQEPHFKLKSRSKLHFSAKLILIEVNNRSIHNTNTNIISVSKWHYKRAAELSRCMYQCKCSALFLQYFFVNFYCLGRIVCCILCMVSGRLKMSHNLQVRCWLQARLSYPGPGNHVDFWRLMFFWWWRMLFRHQMLRRLIASSRINVHPAFCLRFSRAIFIWNMLCNDVKWVWSLPPVGLRSEILVYRIQSVFSNMINTRWWSDRRSARGRQTPWMGSKKLKDDAKGNIFARRRQRDNTLT